VAEKVLLVPGIKGKVGGVLDGVVERPVPSVVPGYNINLATIVC